jgi:hypothetical protein
MMGQPIRGGTAFSQILLDDQILPQLLADVDINKYKGILEEEEEGDLLGEVGVGMDDPCSTAQFQMNMMSSVVKPIADEPEIEIELLE